MLSSSSPAHPADVVATFPDQQPAQVSAAVATARAAAAVWAATPAATRGEALQAAAGALADAAAELTELGIAEVGKPRAEMAAEVSRGIAILRYYAQAALAYGNAVIWKPAPAATAVAQRLTALLAAALPAGLLTLVTGDADAGAALTQTADLISFTGSVSVGRSVRGGSRAAGQNPAIVLQDADLALAARTIAQAAMGYAGRSARPPCG